MLRLLWTISIILFSTSAYGAIGNVVQHKGTASVERSGEKTNLKKGSDIEFKDNVRTGKGGLVSLLLMIQTWLSAHTVPW